MIITFHQEFDASGRLIATHTIDTSNLAVQSMLTALKGNVAAQVLAGYAVPTKLAAYPGQTQWQAILGEVVRLNDATARGLLGV